MTTGQRGTTTISDRVVARIAARAVEEAEGVGGVDRSVFGVRVGGQDRRARAEATVEGDEVTARVGLSVDYPGPIRETTTRARQRIRDRVESLTGLTVRQVDIDVTTFNSAASERGE